MMGGEIRDLETAEVAVQAALTGHLVFSTLHTNDAAGGVSRLMHMGIPPYLITSAATAFIAQRLVRLICTQCRHEVSDPTMARVLVGGGPISSYRGKGCEACRLTGYQGRTGIYEILTVNDRIRELILDKASSDILKREAVRSEEHTSELQSLAYLVCRLLLEKKKKKKTIHNKRYTYTTRQESNATTVHTQ